MKTLKLIKLWLSITITIAAGMFLSAGYALAALPASGVVDNTENWAGKFNSVTVDTNGYPHIAYWCDWNSRLKYAVWDGSKWNKEVVESDGNGDLALYSFSSIAVDSSNRPHIVYAREAAGGNDECIHAVKSGGVWTKTTITMKDTDNSILEASDSYAPAIAFDGNNNFHVAIISRFGTDPICYSLNGAAAQAIPGTTNSAADVSICADKHNNVHLAYRGSVATKKVFYAYKNGASAWVLEQLSTPDAYDGTSETAVALAVDGNDVIHIAYYTAAKKLCHVYKQIGASVWNSEDVPDAAADYGLKPSIAIDSLNRLHITYRDVTNKKVKWAIKTNADADWNIIDVYSATFSYYSSLVVKGDRAYMPYYDTNNYLSFYTNAVSSLPAKLSLRPATAYDFGASATQYQFTLTNIGGVAVSWSAAKPAWLTLPIVSGNISSGQSQVVTATMASRESLDPGDYSGEISLTSNGNNFSIPVSAKVLAISGYIKNGGSSGEGIGDATVSFGASGSVMTKSDEPNKGFYIKKGIPAGTYTITPSKTGQEFSPSPNHNGTVTISTSSAAGIDFYNYNINGRITRYGTGEGINGTAENITVKIKESDVVKYTAPIDSNGYYEKKFIKEGAYKIEPEKVQ